MKRLQTFVQACALLVILAVSLATHPSQAGQSNQPSVLSPIRLNQPMAPQAPPAPTFSQAGGFYTDTVSLNVTVPDTSTIRFTLDGSEPISTSVVYSQPLVLIDRSNDLNAIASITTTGPGYWTPPDGEVFKGTVVRAAAFAGDGVRGPINTQSYFISTDVLTRYAPLPIVSLSTDAGKFL